MENRRQVERVPPILPRTFTMYRGNDESGVSGTGRVLDGAVFDNEQCVVCWRTDREAAAHGYSSLGIYPSFAAFLYLHVRSHPTNDTRIEWSDGTVERY